MGLFWQEKLWKQQDLEGVLLCSSRYDPESFYSNLCYMLTSLGHVFGFYKFRLNVTSSGIPWGLWPEPGRWSPGFLFWFCFPVLHSLCHFFGSGVLVFSICLEDSQISHGVCEVFQAFLPQVWQPETSPVITRCPLKQRRFFTLKEPPF